MMSYPSKIGWPVALPLFATLVATLVFLAWQQAWLGAAIVMATLLFCIHILLTTVYTITGHELTVRCSFFVNKKIPVSSITSIRETNNPISSPAASLDRLELRYNKFDSVIISPKEKARFIQHLLSLNPAIHVHEKQH